MKTVDCSKLVNDVLSDLEDSIRVSHAKITVQELPIVNGYETELRLLFQNLITNAIKFQHTDNLPEINISAGISGNEWIFKIKDNGIGIEDKNKDKIFIIFKRMHNRNDYKGTGIGLAHCKKIVELHGGRIMVESKPGSGSTFIFTIPKGDHE
jgi:light-regulated signal transduction histidine kinase (bacteriophytochrome)